MTAITDVTAAPSCRIRVVCDRQRSWSDHREPTSGEIEKVGRAARRRKPVDIAEGGQVAVWRGPVLGCE